MGTQINERKEEKKLVLLLLCMLTEFILAPIFTMSFIS